MTVSNDIVGVLTGLDVILQDITADTSYKVHIELTNNIYTINEYDMNDTLIASCQVTNEGNVITNSEELQNNLILARAYDILFNYYLITNQLRNPEVILENTSDKFIIKGMSVLTAKYRNPYRITLAPNT